MKKKTKELMSNYQNQLENLEEKIQEVVHYISEGLEKMTVIYMPKQSNGTEQFIT